MPQTQTQKLDTGAPFPELALTLTDGSTLAVPTGNWTLFLLYRGNW
ncbi:hypothetical protein [Roseibacillus persicicus]|uniref:Uncharacterized protein n=1 Tax=Roseibacillus persicicus TaxID=454148 RepID=A0A918WNU7_9BACT|nr:hypothetical protein [Roseibacillus persicicus]MDQ8192244.1 hypothetical protein [Roseibacillus persicicus]GHC64245.1 hypothetical protein GCM10007100_34930 [Roseibacillus persicicus]